MRWLLILSNFWCARAPAETILFQTPGSSRVEYRATLKASARYDSPTQNYLSKHPTAGAREHLLAKFSEAQKAFVSGSPTEARQQFAEIAELATTEDWGRTDREVLLSALLRLAQLETESTLKDKWLGQALLLGPDLNVDRGLFPPPLLLRMGQLQVQAKKINPARTLAESEWSRILVDGVACTKFDCPDYPVTSGNVRITFLSDKWLPQTLIIDLSAAANLKPEKVPWVMGECGHPVFNPRAQAVIDKKGFWDLACETPATGIELARLHPQSPEKEPGLPVPVSSVKPPFYQKTWFWLSVGGLAAVAAIISAQPRRGHDTPEPTTSYGN